MKNNPYGILQKGSYAAIEFILVFPVLVLIGIYTVTDYFLFWLASLPTFFSIGYLFSMLFNNKIKTRFIYMVLMIMISVLTSLIFSDHSITTIIISLVYIFVLYRSKAYYYKSSEDLLTNFTLWVIGLPVYFFAYFIYRYFEALNPFQNIITWSGVLFIIVTLFLSNRGALKASTLPKSKKTKVSKTIKRKNYVYIIIMFGIIFLVTNFGIVKSLFYKTISLFISGILSFLSLFNHESKPIENRPPANEQPLPVIEAGEPSTLAVILEKLMYIAFYIIVTLLFIALIIYGGRRIGHIIRTIYKWLMKQISKFLNLSEPFPQEFPEYIDEKESLLDLNKLQSKVKEKVKGLFRKRFYQQPKWEELSEHERVRYAYKQLVKNQILQGYQFQPSNTSTETLNDIIMRVESKRPELNSLIKSYSKARYGNKPLSSDEVEIVKAFFNSHL